MRNKRRRLVGRVTSTKMSKTLVVRVNVSQRHPVYDKVIHGTRKYYAHDENDTAKEGDLVQIVESRPLSKLKRWALETIVERAGERDAAKRKARAKAPTGLPEEAPSNEALSAGASDTPVDQAS